MADFRAKAPFEATKVHALHDQSAKPAAPAAWRESFRAYLGWPVLGAVLSMGGAALVFELRDAWDSHRDWVPPAGVVGVVPGALALAYLFWRGRMDDLWPGATLLLITLGLTFADWLVGISTDGYGAAEDALTISATVGLGLSVAALVWGFVHSEWKAPVRAPQPE